MPSSPNEKGEPVPAPAARRGDKLIHLARNAISISGLFLVGIGLVLLATCGLFALVAPTVNPYFGIVSYLILPAVFVLGLVIVPLGMLLKEWRLRRQARASGARVTYPPIDLNDKRTRAWGIGFLAFSLVIVLPVLGVSSYFGYEYTESVPFCGQLCHAVMHPQATAHARSPHARVRCAGCHIGPGASWFVKSKITGVGQVIAVLENSYPRPIPVAITHLRPARETCEQCHWPAQFFGYQYKLLVDYASDEGNTRRIVHMMLKVGGPERVRGRAAGGIHLNMLLSGRIEYVATDRDLQHIPWVRFTRLDGRVSVYRDDGQPSHAPPPAGTARLIDCMDCHNRGAHHFRSPQAAVDAYLEDGRLDRTLPYIKREAVAALVGSYMNVPEACRAIDRALTSFYRAQDASLWQQRAAAVRQAVAGVQQIYRDNFFPHMRVTWQTYPENVGHLISPGCFRCHDGRHVDQSGQVITSRCDACHVFLNPVTGHPNTLEEGEFQHPMNLILHFNLRCDQCHDGGVLRNCRDCHTSGVWLLQRGQSEFRRDRH